MENQYTPEQLERLVKAKEANSRSIQSAASAFIHLAESAQRCTDRFSELIEEEAAKRDDKSPEPPAKREKFRL